MASSPRVKPDPEDDDLLMSYLNADYVSTSSPWPSPSSKMNPHTPPPCTSWPLPQLASVLDPFLTPYSPSTVAAAVATTHASETMTPMTAATTSTGNALAVAAAAASSNTPLSYYNTVEYFSNHHIRPPALSNPSHQHQPLSPSPSSSSEDSELPKRKRGRKKREAVFYTCSSSPSAVPAMIAPAPAPLTKDTTAIGLTTQQPSQAAAPHPHSDDDDKAAAAAKRQERLIKNRAAALLSRKRKREHVNALEEQNRQLRDENRHLLEQQQKIHSLTAMFLMMILLCFLPLLANLNRRRNHAKVLLPASSSSLE